MLSDDYLRGFIEGEGMFYVGIVPATGTSRTKSGWHIICFFKVSQNPTGKVVLEYLKQRLDCGYLKPNDKVGSDDKSLAFVVRDLPSLKTKVIPFLDNKLVIKKTNFEKFKRVVNLVSEGKHRNRQDFKKILEIAYSMNTKKRKLTKEQVLKNFKD